jgi:hypothetical protein
VRKERKEEKPPPWSLRVVASATSADDMCVRVYIHKHQHTRAQMQMGMVVWWEGGFIQSNKLCGGGGDSETRRGGNGGGKEGRERKGERERK